MMENASKTICAFANDIDNWGGGYLVIGVKDDQGQPDSLPGVPKEKIDGYLKDMLNKCKRIQPEYMPITEVVEHQEKFFIVVWAPGGSIRPNSSPKNMGPFFGMGDGLQPGDIGNFHTVRLQDQMAKLLLVPGLLTAFSIQLD